MAPKWYFVEEASAAPPGPDAGDRPLAGPTIRIMGIMDLGLMILMVHVATSCPLIC
jgi:hypothetical protein